MSMQKKRKRVQRRLRKSADGYLAPRGWLWQENKKDFIALVRIADKGEWIVDFKGDTIPKDAYISAELIDGLWHTVAFAPSEGHGGGNNRRGKNNAIKEVIKLAVLHDRFEAELNKPRNQRQHITIADIKDDVIKKIGIYNQKQEKNKNGSMQMSIQEEINKKIRFMNKDILDLDDILSKKKRLNINDLKKIKAVIQETDKQEEYLLKNLQKLPKVRQAEVRAFLSRTALMKGAWLDRATVETEIMMKQMKGKIGSKVGQSDEDKKAIYLINAFNQTMQLTKDIDMKPKRITAQKLLAFHGLLVDQQEVIKQLESIDLRKVSDINIKNSVVKLRKDFNNYKFLNQSIVADVEALYPQVKRRKLGVRLPESQRKQMKCPSCGRAQLYIKIEKLPKSEWEIIKRELPTGQTIETRLPQALATVSCFGCTRLEKEIKSFRVPMNAKPIDVYGDVIDKWEEHKKKKQKVSKPQTYEELMASGFFDWADVSESKPPAKKKPTEEPKIEMPKSFKKLNQPKSIGRAWIIEARPNNMFKSKVTYLPLAEAKAQNKSNLGLKFLKRDHGIMVGKSRSNKILVQSFILPKNLYSQKEALQKAKTLQKQLFKEKQIL